MQKHRACSEGVGMTVEQIIESHLDKAVFMEHLTERQQKEVCDFICDIIRDVLEEVKGGK